MEVWREDMLLPSNLQAAPAPGSPLLPDAPGSQEQGA